MTGVILADPTEIHQILMNLGTNAVHFVDDEALIADIAEELLEKLGYQVIARKGSAKALAIFENDQDQFDLVITDQTMLNMTGVDLCKRILQLRPDIPIILCTGYSSTASQSEARLAGIREFTSKPVSSRQLGRLIRKGLVEIRPPGLFVAATAIFLLQF